MISFIINSKKNFKKIDNNIFIEKSDIYVTIYFDYI